MAQSKKSTPAKNRAKNVVPDFDLASLAAKVEDEFSGKEPNKEEGKKPKKKAVQAASFDDLEPVDSQIPYNRQFLSANFGIKSNGQKGAGIMGKFGSNVKGLLGNLRSQGMEREDIIRLRKMVGSLKKTKVEAGSKSKGPELTAETLPKELKTKRDLLKEKRKKIKQNSKEKAGLKDKNLIGLRIELEKLKKKYPADENLVVLDAILTSRDGCLPHRSIEERVASLSAALRDAGNIVVNKYLTTFSIDTLFDIYFLYLEALNKLYVDRFRKVSAATIRANPVLVSSIKRDIKILKILMDQFKLKKTIANIAQKLNGFGYPFMSMTPMFVAKSFSDSGGNDNDKIGPGTYKLNKFLIRIYLSVFAQIPMFQSIASKFCDALPGDDYQSKIMIANVNMDNAYTQLKIAKATNDPAVQKQTLSLFSYGSQFVKSTIKNNANSAAEGRIMLRTAEMAEEYGFLTEKVEPEILKFGYECASMTLSFYKEEAEAIIRRLYEIADIRKINIEGSD
jgi:hypothetical protein